MTAAKATALLKKNGSPDGYDTMTDEQFDEMRSEIAEAMREQVHGSHDCYWLGFYDYMFNVLKLPDNRLAPLMELVQHCGWWAAYDDTVIFQDRPQHIKLDEQNRLHCSDGPAILYRDGYTVYAWRGVRIPREWLAEPGSLTPQDALQWRNVEQRNAACQILGWDKILSALDAKVIDEDPLPQFGTLLEAELPDHGKQRFLRAKCGTGRDVVLLIDDMSINTARAAGAYTYGIPVENYNPVVRT